MTTNVLLRRPSYRYGLLDAYHTQSQLIQNVEYRPEHPLQLISLHDDDDSREEIRLGLQGLTFGSSAPRKLDCETEHNVGPVSKRVKSDNQSSTKLACPFLKHYPDQFLTREPCASSSWRDVAHVKEHVKRKHQRPPNRCARCGQDFESPADLSNHQNSEVTCTEVSHSSDCVTEAQLEVLLSRKGQRGLNQAQKWSRMYSNIFPNEESVPSPYYDQTDRIKSKLVGLSTSAGVSESHRRRLEELVQNLLQSGDTENEAQSTTTAAAHSPPKSDPLPGSLNTESPPPLIQALPQPDKTKFDDMLLHPDTPSAIRHSPVQNDHLPESLSRESLPRLVPDSPQRDATNLDNKFLPFMGDMEGPIIDELGGNESLFLNDDPFPPPEAS
ncbi:hypothetical protein F5Y03DRAFT_363287 [Xylaria venustula]|nr:hypothetical protein F5Y03DRAFT_363287 [Xylaria venustula]